MALYRVRLPAESADAALSGSAMRSSAWARDRRSDRGGGAFDSRKRRFMKSNELMQLSFPSKAKREALLSQGLEKLPWLMGEKLLPDVTPRTSDAGALIVVRSGIVPCSIGSRGDIVEVIGIGEVQIIFRIDQVVLTVGVLAASG
jgi:hypothetical protein